MCVIITIENGEFPKFNTLKEAEALNSHGGSIAWIENGKTNFHKGIKAKQINKMIQKKLIPNGVKTAIIHFRIASIGSVKQKLCHPFVIDSKATSDLKGSDMEESLLFHNGTWNEYQTHLIQSIKGKMVKIPNGEYSDSRIMAFLSYHLGIEKAMSLISGWNKIAILTPKGIKKYGSNWVKIDQNECSNDYFQVKKNNYYNFQYFDNDEKDQIKSRICWNKTDCKKYDKMIKKGIPDYEIEDLFNSGYQLNEIENFFDTDFEPYQNSLYRDF